MEKIKASELLSNIIYDSQKSFLNEEPQLQNALLNKEPKNFDKITYEDLLSAIRTNNEFLRISFAKTIIRTLQGYNIIENDIDIFNTDVTNNILVNSVGKATD